MTEYEDIQLCGIWNSFNLVYLTYMKFSIWHEWKKVKVCIKTCTGSEWSQIQDRKLLHYPQATKWSSSKIQRPFKCCGHIYLLTLRLRTSWIHSTELDHIWRIRIHFQQSKLAKLGYQFLYVISGRNPSVKTKVTSSPPLSHFFWPSPCKSITQALLRTMFVGKTVLQMFKE